jgi:hypothetical protein
MKNLIFSLLLLISVSAKAQYLFEIPLMEDKNWSLIAEKHYIQKANGKSIPVFPARLQVMNNKVIELPGYMVPIKTGMLHDKFMYAIVPLIQCSFCGMDGIPDMVEVHLSKGVRYTYNLIKVRGKLVLNTTGDNIVTEVMLTDAEVVGEY